MSNYTISNCGYARCTVRLPRPAAVAADMAVGEFAEILDPLYAHHIVKRVPSVNGKVTLVGINSTHTWANSPSLEVKILPPNTTISITI